MVNLISRILCFCFLCFSQFTFSQTYVEHSFESEVYGTERTISIYLPETYTTYAPEDAVPVTYVFDAHYVAFRDMIYNNIDYLSQNLEILSTICVGIHHEDRSEELTPSLNSDDNLLARHLAEEVFPYIEKTYRTQPFRIGIGHSRGGMFLIDALSSGNNLFNAYIAISPSLGFNNQMIHGKANAMLAKGMAPKAFVFISIGGEETNYFDAIDAMNAIYDNEELNTVKWNYTKYPNRSHWGTVVPSIADGLISLKRLITLDETEINKMARSDDESMVKKLNQFYTDASEWANFDVSPNAYTLNEFAYMLMNQDHVKQGGEIIDYAIQLDPRNPNLQDSKGDVFEKLGFVKKAHDQYQKALVMLEEEKHRVPDERYLELKNIMKVNIERTKQ